MTPDLDVACHLNVLVAETSPGEVTAALDVLAELGYRRVVFPPLDPEATDAAALRRILEDHAISPITLAGQAPGANVASDDPAERAAGAEALRRTVDLTVALGGDQMNGVPYGLFGEAGPTSDETFLRSAAAVGPVADYAFERGVTMTFEVLNRYETSVVNTAAQAMRFAEASGSAHLRIHLDTFHMGVEEADLSAAIRHALPRLAYLELGQSGRGMLSTGGLDLPEVVRQALDDGYEGRWGVEAFRRSSLLEGVANALTIWRDPYTDGRSLAEDALHVIGSGWSASTVGRRASRLARCASA